MDRRSAIRKTAVGAAGTALTPTLLSLLQSCQSIDRPNWQPVFLTGERAKFMTAFVDTLLPATDTPGGLDVKVDVFIDRVFGETMDESGQNSVNQEIDKIIDLCKEKMGGALHELNTSDRVAFFEILEKQNRGKFRPSVWGTPVGEEKEPVGFYRSLKSTILWGYFTSEKVGKEILNYDPIPGVYQGCIPLADVGSLWSL